MERNQKEILFTAVIVPFKYYILYLSFNSKMYNIELNNKKKQNIMDGWLYCKNA